MRYEIVNCKSKLKMVFGVPRTPKTGSKTIFKTASKQPCFSTLNVHNYLAGSPPEPFKEVFNSLARRIVECTVPKSIANHFRHYDTARECIDYLTKRFDKPRQSEQARTEGRMGEKGETPHGRDDEAAAATGPGMKTTDHQKTDGGSLATPASGPSSSQPEG